MVFLGGGLGSICRYGITHLLSGYELTFPLATFLANALSCVALGVLTGLTLRDSLTDPHYRLGLMTGFCGGFSTFSTFTNETLTLFANGQIGYALVNVGGSLVVCLGGIYLGIRMVY